MSKTLLATAAAVLAVASATGALAQAAQPAARPAQAAAPAPAPVGGPVIPGVCLFSEAAAVANSDVGKAVNTRMEQLGAAVQAELRPERTAIENEENALRTARPTTQEEQNALQTRALALRQRGENFERLGATRVRELQLTQEKQLNRIAQEMEPAIRAVYAQKNCGLMYDRNAAYLFNPEMDVTDEVIAALNGRIRTLTFDRERLPAPNAQQGAAGQARPAGAAPAANRPAAPAQPRPAGQRPGG